VKDKSLEFLALEELKEIVGKLFDEVTEIGTTLLDMQRDYRVVNGMCLKCGRRNDKCDCR
jgi:hypothetical protein